MKRSPSLWIAVLTLTAVVLGAINLFAPSRSAKAEMINVQNNFSLMTSGTTGGDEALIVIDKNRGKMVVYHLNGTTLDILAARSL